MVGSFYRLAAAAAFSALLAGCATSPEPETFSDNSPVTGAVVATPDKPLSCVPYARARSGIDIHGDAYTWWDKAEGRFARSSTPSEGAVLVLSGSSRGHVAVVSRIVSSREIRIDHANWLNDGAIYLSDPVTDVSASNDWSQVRVWNPQTGTWGVRTYSVQGFIEPQPASGDVRMARSGPDEIAKLIQETN